jgi:hypothetical protein
MPGTGRHSPEQRWRKRAHENGNSSVIPISNRDHVNQIATAIPLGTQTRFSDDIHIETEGVFA